MIKQLNIIHILLLAGGSFLIYKLFFAESDEDEASESLDLVQDAIDDLERSDALDEVEPEPFELDEKLQDTRY